jgi:hypothetical protein
MGGYKRGDDPDDNLQERARDGRRFAVFYIGFCIVFASVILAASGYFHVTLCPTVCADVDAGSQ